MEVGKCTGVLLLISLMSLYLELYLDLLAEFLEISLYNLYIVYKSAAVLLNATYALFSGFKGQWNALA